MRFFLFLGTLDSFSFLIRLIVKGLDDMKYFLIVFFIGVFAFSDAFLSVREILRINAKEEEIAAVASTATTEQDDLLKQLNEAFPTPTTA